MVTRPKTGPPVRLADKEELNRLLDESEKRKGFLPDPDATIEKLCEMLRAEGFRPEDNSLSREIVQMRYGEE